MFTLSETKISGKDEIEFGSVSGRRSGAIRDGKKRSDLVGEPRSLARHDEMEDVLRTNVDEREACMGGVGHMSQAVEEKRRKEKFPGKMLINVCRDLEQILKKYSWGI